MGTAVKPVLNSHSQKDQKLFFMTNYRLMQVKSNAECSKGSILPHYAPRGAFCRIMLQGEHSAILLTFIKLPFIIKRCVLSILEWPFKTGFTIQAFIIWNGYHDIPHRVNMISILCQQLDLKQKYFYIFVLNFSTRIKIFNFR